jgi:excisionase family DNA binding protein
MNKTRSDNPHASRPDHSGATGEHLYAAQAAAELLGIHRTTLYLAVRKMKLVPDAYTPGGHARFRRETLERFRDRLTLDSATGGDGSIARAVARAVASLSHFTTLQPVCEAVADAALMACPSFATCILLARDHHCLSGYDLRLLTERGLPQRICLEYRFLHRRPGLDFITALVARNRTPFLCGDVLSPGVVAPEGSLLMLSDAGYRSCAALPCVSDDATLGILMCLGRAPCDLSEPESVALGNLADVLTVALRRERREEAARCQSAAIGELMRWAQLPVSDSGDQFSEVRRICRQGVRARLVGEWDPGESNVPPPLADLLRAAANAATSQRAEWIDQDGPRIALAIPTQALGQAPARPAAVGAVWRRQDFGAGFDAGMELALLHVYAQACAAIASR